MKYEVKKTPSFCVLTYLEVIYVLMGLPVLK